jgi:hypothetical protein
MRILGRTGADAIAITNYFSLNPQNKPTTVAQVCSRTIQEGIIEKERPWWQAHADLAREYNKMLLTYEAGQHLLPGRHGSNELIWEAQIADCMYDVYTTALQQSEELGYELWLNFSDISNRTSVWGCWGVLESAYQEPPYTGGSHELYGNPAPKYRALLDYAGFPAAQTAVPEPGVYNYGTGVSSRAPQTPHRSVNYRDGVGERAVFTLRGQRVRSSALPAGLTVHAGRGIASSVRVNLTVPR